MTLRDIVDRATIREVDRRDPVEMAKWLDAQSAAIRDRLAALRDEDRV